MCCSCCDVYYKSLQTLWYRYTDMKTMGVQFSYFKLCSTRAAELPFAIRKCIERAKKRCPSIPMPFYPDSVPRPVWYTRFIFRKSCCCDQCTGTTLAEARTEQAHQVSSLCTRSSGGHPVMYFKSVLHVFPARVKIRPKT